MKLLFLLIALFAPLTGAEDNSPLHAELITDVDAVSPGSTFLAGVEISLKEGWKAYWKNPGESGSSLLLKWNLPEGFETKELDWPVPERKVINGIVAFVYHHPFTILTEIKAPNSLASFKEIPLEVVVDWLVCSEEQCLPGESTAKKTMPTAGAAKRNETAFEEIKKNLPVPLEGAQVAVEEGSYVIKFPESAFGGPVDEVHFYPTTNDGLNLHEGPSLVEEEGQYHLILKRKEGESPKKMEGVISLISKAPSKEKNYLVSLPIPEKPITPISALEDQDPLLLTLIFSFLGGLLLNIMPCVLPVISLKIMSFVKLSEESRRLTILHGLSFSLGVILSFLALASLLFILQGQGMDVGWGFQLQDPTFVGLLAALLLLMSLLFFGVFELGTGLASRVGTYEHKVKKKNPSLTGSFASGILATALSTPCSGPFLGTALGLSMTLPRHLGILIFLAMGVGMAFPYMLLSWQPKWLKFIPKPGPWMETFKEVMGFLLLLTVVWLMWVFVAQADSGATLTFFVALFVVGLGAWMLGKFGTYLRSPPTRWVGRFAAISLFVFATMLIVQVGRDLSVFNPAEKSHADIARGWENFSPERVEALRKEGTPLFIDFTAKWCLLCQSNFLVLESGPIKEAFEKRGIVRMEADWTRNDPDITRAIASFGRNSVPLYVFYPKGKDSKPEILPQLLTPANILEAIEK